MCYNGILGMRNDSLISIYAVWGVEKVSLAYGAEEKTGTLWPYFQILLDEPDTKLMLASSAVNSRAL